MDDLHINTIEKCERCGRFTVDYEVREYGYDSATGYIDDEIICSECASPNREIDAELARLDREVERGLHSLPVLSGNPLLQTGRKHGA